MALTKSSEKRREVATGQEFRTFEDSDSVASQGVAVVDDSGNQVGVAENPLIVSPGVLGGVNLDAFGRQRVSQPVVLLSLVHDHSKRPEIVTEKTSGDGTSTHVATSKYVAMTVSTAGDEVVRQTRERFVYRAGQSVLFFGTFRWGSVDELVTMELGLHDGDDGILLGCVNGSIQLRIEATGAASQAVPRSSWDDPMDGTGQSGVELDFTKAQIFWIDLEWLGVGTVRCGFVVDGRLYVAHTFHHANGIFGPYMRTATLPVRYRIRANGTPSGSVTMRQICAAVLREGSKIEPGPTYTVNSGSTVDVTESSDWNAVIGIRAKSTFTDATIELIATQTINLDSADPIEYAIVRNPNHAGTFSDVNSDSAVEWSETTGTITDGDWEHQIDHRYVGAAQFSRGGVGDENFTLPPRLGRRFDSGDGDYDDRDEFWLIARTLDGASSCRSSMTFHELRG